MPEEPEDAVPTNTGRCLDDFLTFEGRMLKLEA